MFCEPSDPSLASLRDWSRRRARGAWVWPLLALALIALMLAFALWIGMHFNHLHGYWRAVREMELGALRVPAERSLSVMLPVWVGLGLTAYMVAVAAVLRLWWLERGWRALAQRVLDRSG